MKWVVSFVWKPTCNTNSNTQTPTPSEFKPVFPEFKLTLLNMSQPVAAPAPQTNPENKSVN